MNTARAKLLPPRASFAAPHAVPRVACAGACVPPARGFSLIIAMLMLAIIGLASAAILRNATSGDQVANNNRLQTQAHQYAQFALRWCEHQLALDAGSRAVPVLAAADPPAWSRPQSWTARGGARAAHTLAATEMGSAVQPRVAPQCLIESAPVPDVVVVTARGFSADFSADAVTGATRNGSVAWLQATLQAGGAGAGAGASASAGAAAGPANVRQRLWQQLLTPPF